jgi:putative membrane protein
VAASSERIEFPIKTKAVASYAYWQTILMLVLVFGWFFGAGVVLAVVYALTFGHWLSRNQAEALQYWLDGRTLMVNEGVFFLKRKSIPLDRITDIVMAQGPLLRFFGLWQLNIQTAGAGQPRAEASLYGLVQAAEVRDTLLQARDRAAGTQSTAAD